MTGQTLSHYRILEKLGEGGMGVVYKAEDTKLKRTVALKLLPAHLTEHKARFLREAQAAAALNHPNICTIHEIDEQHPFIAMEFLDGITLKDKISHRPLPLAEALDIAIQTCQGLQHAHEKGVVHRDIKPANIMVTPTGQVKIMDFGLAQIGDRTRITKTGSSLGTPAYMSPEQAKGEPADRRSDIWSLGITLYEMLAGSPPFKGNVEAAVARAIVSDTPEPLTSLRTGLPLELDRVVAKALAKQPGDRFQNVEDMEVDLRSLTKPNVARPPVRTGNLRMFVTGAVICSLLVTLMFFAGRWSTQPAEIIPVVFTLESGGSAFEDRQFALSPDGTRLAYSVRPENAPRSIWIRSLASATAEHVRGTENGYAPFWSPDGRWIGFFADGKLKKISSSGGSAFEVTATSGQSGAWSPDGDIITSRNNRSAFLRVAAGGGQAAPFTSLDTARNVNSHRFPSFLPDGRLLFTARATKENTEIMVRASGGESKVLLHAQSNAQFAPLNGGSDGYLLFLSNSALFAQRFDSATLKLSGDPIQVAGGVIYNAAGAFGAFSASSNGRTLAYLKGSVPLRQLTWYGATGATLGTLGPAGELTGPRISPDGKLVVFGKPDPQTGNRALWTVNTQSQVVERLTLDPGNNWQANWSRDGSRILFASDREDGILKPFTKAPQAASIETRLHDIRADPMDLSPDDKLLLFASSGTSGLEILKLAQPRTQTPFLKPAFGEQDAKFSPDGKWVAYTSNKSGSFEVYVRSFHLEGGTEPTEYRVSTGSGAGPRWRGDGRELYYLDQEQAVMAVRFEYARPLPARRLFQSCLRSFWTANWQSTYDVTTEGTRFLFACDVPSPPMQIHVVVNWTKLLRQPQ